MIGTTPRGVAQTWLARVVFAVSVLVAAGCGGEPDHMDIGVAMSEGMMAQAEGRDEEAEERFDDVVQASPGNRVALYNLGMLRRSRGDIDGAIAAFSQLVEAQPDFAAARLQLAMTKQLAGDVVGAIADLRKVVEQEPGNAEAQTLLDALLEATSEVPVTSK